MVEYFDKTLPYLTEFLNDENNLVKRSVGVAMHFFSKRVLDEPDKTKRLLTLVEPDMEAKQGDVIKGIGWGLKTIGRHHPDLLIQFLRKQIKLKKKISRVMLRKALTYIDQDKRLEIEELIKASPRNE